MHREKRGQWTHGSADDSTLPADDTSDDDTGHYGYDTAYDTATDTGDDGVATLPADDTGEDGVTTLPA